MSAPSSKVRRRGNLHSTSTRRTKAVVAPLEWWTLLSLPHDSGRPSRRRNCRVCGCESAVRLTAALSLQLALAQLNRVRQSIK